MSVRELVLANVNETIRGFFVGSMNDVVDEKWFEISLPEMRQALISVNLEIGTRAIARKWFALVHAVRKGGKAW